MRFYQPNRDTEGGPSASPTHQRNVPDLAEAEDRRDRARGVLREVHALIAQDNVHVHLVHRLGDHHARLVGPDPLVDTSFRVPLQERVQFAVPLGERVHGAHSGHGVGVREGAPAASTFIKGSRVSVVPGWGPVPYVLKTDKCIVCLLRDQRVQLRAPISAQPLVSCDTTSLSRAHGESYWLVKQRTLIGPLLLGHPRPVGLFTADMNSSVNRQNKCYFGRPTFKSASIYIAKNTISGNTVSALALKIFFYVVCYFLLVLSIVSVYLPYPTYLQLFPGDSASWQQACL